MGHLSRVGQQAIIPDYYIDHKIPAQHDHIVEEYGVGRGMQQHIKHPLRLSYIHHNKEHTHGYCCNGKKLTKDDNLSIFLIVMKIQRYDYHHSGCGHSDQVCELCNINTP